jgi:AcrR family transcriptional regulator
VFPQTHYLSLPNMSQRATTVTESPLKREAIIEHAIATFAEDGFRNADVQAIADGAGVGKGTVYRYFGNKEELFWATCMAVLERLAAHLMAAVSPVESPLEKLRAAASAYAGFFEANPRYLEVFVQERAQFRGYVPENHLNYHEKLFDRFGEILQRGIQLGEFRDVDVRKTMISLNGVVYGSVVWACYAKDDRPLPERTLHAVDIFFDGIRANPNPDEPGY